MLGYFCYEIEWVEYLKVSRDSGFEQVIVMDWIGKGIPFSSPVDNFTARLAERESRRVFVQADNTGKAEWTAADILSQPFDGFMVIGLYSYAAINCES